MRLRHTTGISALFPQGFDPISDVAIMGSLFMLANHADLLGRDGNFWSDVAYILVMWMAARAFPKWTGIGQYRP